MMAYGIIIEQTGGGGMSANGMESEYAYAPGRKQGFFLTPLDLDTDWRVPLYQTAQFSYGCLLKTSTPALITGAALLTISAYLPYIIAAHVPPVALTLLIVAGAMLIAYGLYQGLQYAHTPTLKAGYEEDVESPQQRQESCWERFTKA